MGRMLVVVFDSETKVAQTRTAQRMGQLTGFTS